MRGTAWIFPIGWRRWIAPSAAAVLTPGQLLADGVAHRLRDVHAFDATHQWSRLIGGGTGSRPYFTGPE